MSAQQMPDEMGYQIEQSVIGALLQDNGAFEAAQPLNPGDFIDPAHGAIFATIGALVPGADPITVHERLSAAGKADRCGGLPYLIQLEQCVPSAANVALHAKLLRGKAAQRKVLALLDRAKQDVMSATDPDAAIAHAHGALGELVRPAVDEHFTDWPDGRIGNYFEAEPPAVAWFAHQRLLAGRGHLLAGVGGSSKTRILYHLGMAAAFGRLPWDWDVSSTGSAALFLTEDVAAQVHRVLHQMGRHLSPQDRQRLAERMRVFPLAGRRAILLELNGNALQETRAYDWLMRQIDALPKPVAFIGIDPALGVTEGDELSPAHQRRLGEMIDRIGIQSGACAVLAAHATKAMHSAEELGSHSARGSGAITDAVRGEFTVRNMTADEARRFGIDDRADRQMYVQLAATKGNELPPEAYAPVWLKRNAHGGLEQVTLEQIERGSVGARELQALELLKATAPNGDTTMKFWRGQCVAAGVIANGSLSAQEKAMERIRDALKAAGMVETTGRGLWKPT